MYYSRNQSRTWLAVGWWGLSCHLLYRSSAIVALGAECCMLTVCSDPPWCSSDLDDIKWQCPAVGGCLTKSQIGCCKFVHSWSRCWCAGINSGGVVPGFTNCTDWEPQLCLPNRELSPRLLPSPVQLWPALFQRY